MLADLPVAIGKELDPGVGHEQVHRPIGATSGDLTQPVQLRKIGGDPGGLPEEPLKQNHDRQAELDRRFQEDQGRPARPLCGASQVIILSIRVGNELRFLSATL